MVRIRSRKSNWRLFSDRRVRCGLGDFLGSTLPSDQEWRTISILRQFTSLPVDVIFQPGVSVRRDFLVKVRIRRAQPLRNLPLIRNSVVLRFRAGRKSRHRVILPVRIGTIRPAKCLPGEGHAVRPKSAVAAILILAHDALIRRVAV
jgi:hypothetical protein